MRSAADASPLKTDITHPLKRKSDTTDQVHIFQSPASSPGPTKRARLASSLATPPSPTIASCKRKAGAIDQIPTPALSTYSQHLKRARHGSDPSFPRWPTAASSKRKSDAINEARIPQLSTSSPPPKRTRPDLGPSAPRPSILAPAKRDFNQYQPAQSSDTVLPAQKRVFFNPAIKENQQVREAQDAQLANWIYVYIRKSKTANNGKLGRRVRDLLGNELSQLPGACSKAARFSAASFSSPLTAKKPAHLSKTHLMPSTSNTLGGQGQTCAPATATSSATQTPMNFGTSADSNRLQSFEHITVTTAVTQTEMGHLGASRVVSGCQTEPLTHPTMVSAATQTQVDCEAFHCTPSHHNQAAAPVATPTVATQIEIGHQTPGLALGSQPEICPATAPTANVTEEEINLEDPSFFSDILAKAADTTITKTVTDVSAITASSLDPNFDASPGYVDQDHQDDRHPTRFYSREKMEKTAAQHYFARTAPQKPPSEIQGPPLVDPTRVRVVQCRLRPETTKPKAITKPEKAPLIIDDDDDDVITSTSQGTSQRQPIQDSVIDLCDSDDDDSAPTTSRDTSEATSSGPASRSPGISNGVVNKYSFYGINSRKY